MVPLCLESDPHSMCGSRSRTKFFQIKTENNFRKLVITFVLLGVSCIVASFSYYLTFSFSPYQYYFMSSSNLPQFFHKFLNISQLSSDHHRALPNETCKTAPCCPHCKLCLQYGEKEKNFL